MLKELKRILDKYSEEELEEMNLWINAEDGIKMICIEEDAITLITEESMENLEVNGKLW